MRTRERIVDELLVLAAQAGRVDAFARLASRWHPRLLRHARRLTGDADGAQEAVQEAWVAIARGLGRLRDPAAFGEPGMPELAIGVFRGRLRWYGAMFLAMILVCAVVAVYCASRFLSATDLPEMLRQGAGFFLCLMVALSGKTWYWMQMEHVAMTREIKRVELLIAHLATELRARP